MAQFYFAWVDSTETTFGAEHKRFDEQVFDFQLHHAEGDFASLDITIVNPRVGFLAPGRKVWAWFGYEHPTLGTKPLFFGRLIGVPEDLQEEQVKLSFVARPEDFAAQKIALAETMKVPPYWDPIWFSPETVDDPDNVLESRPELWHIDRQSLAVTSSNIINGEDGIISLGEADVFYDSVHVRYGSPPARHIEVAASVSWDQKATGGLDITQKVLQAFGGPLAQSYTGEGLVNDWPKAGSSLGGGWAVQSSFANPVSYNAPMTLFEVGWEIPTQERKNGVPFETFDYDGQFQPHGGLVFVKWGISVNLTLGYDVSRQRSENLSFVLSADIQSVLTEPGDEEVIRLTLSSSEVTQPVDESGALPIRDQRAAAYFSTERGTQSVEYLLALARSRLLARARCVFVSVEIPFDDAIGHELSCRKNVVLTDARMPGGTASGKITEYSLSLDGDTGEAVCAISFGCTPGHGGVVTEVAGEPAYVDDDYVDADYQQHTGQLVMPFAGEVLYTPIEGQPPNDDGINFFNMDVNDVVKSLTISNTAAEQEAQFPFHGPASTQFPLGTWSQYYLVNVAGTVGFRPDYDPVNAISALNEAKTVVNLTLKPLAGGPFATDYVLDVSDLAVPNLIDLEASS